MTLHWLGSSFKCCRKGSRYEEDSAPGYGTYNCRFCDLNLDDMGTGEDMHSADCLIRTLRSVLAATEGKKGVK